MWEQVAAAAISVGGALLGGSAEKKAAKKAIEQQRYVEGQAEGVRRNLYTEGDKVLKSTQAASEDVRQSTISAGQMVLDDSSGTREVRDIASKQLSDILTGNIKTTPGYEFIRNESLRGVARQESAAGRNVSGNQLIALQDRASNLASAEYTNLLTSLQSLLGTTSQITANANNTYANMVSNANNMYSSLFQFGEGTRASMVGAGEAGYLDTARGVGEATSGINLYQGKQQAENIGNMASTIGTTIGTIWGDKDKEGEK